MTDISYADIVALAQRRMVLLSGELAGYLVLGVVDQLGTAEARVAECDVWLEEAGHVEIGRLESCSPEIRDQSLRGLLAGLLDAAASTSPALSRAASAVDRGIPQAFANDLRTALIPVNRGAARRALSRLYREAVSALRFGGLLGGSVGLRRPPNGVDVSTAEAFQVDSKNGHRGPAEGEVTLHGGSVQRQSLAAGGLGGAARVDFSHDSSAGGHREPANVHPGSSDVFEVARAMAPLSPSPPAERVSSSVTARPSVHGNGLAPPKVTEEGLTDDPIVESPLSQPRSCTSVVASPCSPLSDWDKTAVDAVVEIDESEIQYLEREFGAASGTALCARQCLQMGLESEETLYRSRDLAISSARSTVETLFQQFPHEPLWSEAELCQRLRLVAGFPSALSAQPTGVPPQISAPEESGGYWDALTCGRGGFGTSVAC